MSRLRSCFRLNRRCSNERSSHEIPGAGVEELRKDDPNTPVTLNLIRTLIRREVIPSVQVGRGRLIIMTRCCPILRTHRRQILSRYTVSGVSMRRCEPMRSQTTYQPAGKTRSRARLLQTCLASTRCGICKRQSSGNGKAGAVILSTCSDGGGYYLSNDPLEIAAFIRTLHNRANSTLRSLESAQAALDELQGRGREVGD